MSTVTTHTHTAAAPLLPLLLVAPLSLTTLYTAIATTADTIIAATINATTFICHRYFE
jgi:hypothetical protein